MVLGSVGGQKNRCKSRMPSQELNKATWLRPHPLFSPRFTCLPTKNPCVPICRTEQPNEAADSEERPAKRIKVEHCSSEEVSKVANPFLIWKSTNSRKIGFTRGSLVVDGYPHFLEIYFVLQYIIILYYTKYRLYRTHSFTQKKYCCHGPCEENASNQQFVRADSWRRIWWLPLFAITWALPISGQARDATCQTLKPRSRYKMDSKSFCPVICPKVQLWQWWVEGRASISPKNQPCNWQLLDDLILHILFWGAALQHTQEAGEVVSDPTGRWWSFNIDGGHYLILEKKGLPEHLKSIENLDRAVTLASLLTDLEDLGEASRCSIHVIYLSSAW